MQENPSDQDIDDLSSVRCRCSQGPTHPLPAVNLRRCRGSARWSPSQSCLMSPVVQLTPLNPWPRPCARSSVLISPGASPSGRSAFGRPRGHQHLVARGDARVTSLCRRILRCRLLPKLPASLRRSPPVRRRDGEGLPEWWTHRSCSTRCPPQSTSETASITSTGSSTRCTRIHIGRSWGSTPDGVEGITVIDRLSIRLPLDVALTEQSNS